MATISIFNPQPRNLAPIFQQNPVDPRKRKMQVAFDLLTGLGTGILANSGPSSTPTSLGPGIAKGLEYGGQLTQQRIGNERDQALDDLRQQDAQRQAAQFAWEQSKAQDAETDRAKKQADFDALLPTLPPELQKTAKVMGLPFLDEYAKQQVGAQFPKPEDVPSSVQEYNLSVKQGYKGGFDQWKKEQSAAGRANTTVNVGPSGIDYGDPEAGLAWARNPDGTVKLDERGIPIAEPYQGGKAFIAAQNATAADAAKVKTEKQTANIVTDNVTRIKEKMAGATLPTTGTFGPFVAKIGGTAANDVRAMVNTIKANVGFDKLQQMRNASPTGGALGAVSEQENAMLQASIANLEQSQTQDQFIYNLDQVNTLYDQIVNGGTTTAPNAPTPGDLKKLSDQQLLDLLNK